jgi:hypothetical protein
MFHQAIRERPRRMALRYYAKHNWQKPKIHRFEVIRDVTQV